MKRTTTSSASSVHHAAARAALATFALLSACSSLPHLGATAVTGAPGSVLRVGIASNYPPLAFKKDDHPAGVEADLAQKLGPELDATVTVVETNWEDLIPALQDRKIDVIMSGMSITDERQQEVAFTDSYFSVSQMAIVRSADYDRLRDYTAINQAATRIGVMAGTTGAAYVRTNLSHAAIKDFDSVDDAVAALRLGQIDVFVHDAPAIWAIRGRPLFADDQLKGIYTPLTEEQLAWAVRKDDGDGLRQRLNAVLAKWKASGQLDNVLDQWIPVRRRVLVAPTDVKTR